jgi:plasmid stabilization system protein ParE
VKPYAFHPEADQEYTDAAQYYARISPELAARFYSEVERLISELRKNPDRFQGVDPRARRHFSDLFPYAVIYADQPERVLILAVMHMKRRPGYWKERLT